MALDFTDLASRYANARIDKAMQPFNDPEAYMNNRMQQDFGVDTSGNVRPKSTTISYNEDGSQTVTTKQEVTPEAAPAPVAAPMPQVSPTISNSALPLLPQAAPQPMYMPPQAAPVAQAPVAPVEPAAIPQAEAPKVETTPMPTTGPESQPTAGAGPIAAQAPVAPVTLPQPGPGVQVAGPTQMPPAPVAPTPVAATPAPAPQAAPVTTPATLPTATAAGQLQSWTDDIAKIQGNVTELGKYIANEKNPEEGRAFAGRVIGKMYKEKEMQDTAQRKAMEAVQTGDLLPLVKETKKNTEEASYIKAYLFARLGLTELAKQEQQKLGAGASYQAVTGPNNEKAIIQYNANGLPMKGFDSAGKQLSEEKLALLSANALPTKAHLLPSAHGTPVVNAQGVMGQMMYDPQTQSTYVQVGDKRMNTAGWTTMAQNVQNVYGAAGAKQQGTQAAQGYTNQPMPAMPGAAPQAVQAPVALPGGPAAMPAAAPTAAQVTPIPQSTGAQVTPLPVAATPAEVPAAPVAPRPALSTPTITAPAGGGATPGGPVYLQQQQAAINKAAAEAEIQRKKELAVAEQKPPAEAKGKNVAKDINNQNFANETYDLIKPVAELIKQSTGSGIGTKVDKLASQFGVGTEGAQKIAQLEPLVYPILMNVPRFEGSQSDADVKNYQRAAGDFANSEKPVATRLAALQGMITLLKKYDKEGKNDWSFAGTAGGAQQEKTVNGVTYVYDGTGWKPKK